MPFKEELSKAEEERFEQLVRRYAERLKPIVDAKEAAWERFQSWLKAFQEFRRAHEPKPVQVERAW
mgnify:CR=1 FL=1